MFSYTSEHTNIREVLWQCEGDLGKVNQTGIKDNSGNKFRLTIDKDADLKLNVTAIREEITLPALERYVVKFIKAIPGASRLGAWFEQRLRESLVNSRHQDCRTLPGFKINQPPGSARPENNIQTLFTQGGDYSRRAKDKMSDIEKIPASALRLEANDFRCPLCGETLTSANAVLLKVTVNLDDIDKPLKARRKAGHEASQYVKNKVRECNAQLSNEQLNSAKARQSVSEQPDDPGVQPVSALKPKQNHKQLLIAVSKNGLSAALANKKAEIHSRCKFEDQNYSIPISGDDILDGEVEQLTAGHELIYMKNTYYNSLGKLYNGQDYKDNWPGGFAFADLDPVRPEADTPGRG